MYRQSNLVIKIQFIQQFKYEHSSPKDEPSTYIGIHKWNVVQLVPTRHKRNQVNTLCFIQKIKLLII